MRSKLGVCQWFHYEDYAEVERAVALMRDLGIRHLRTGISWADFYRPRGKQWYDWLMRTLREFEVLLSIWHTPPSISENGQCSGPPRRLKDYADFLDLVIREYDDRFRDLELWNEPNNRLKWDFRACDPGWRKFGRMINMAAHWAKRQGKMTVLGGMIPVDPHWLHLMEEDHQALRDVDVIAIHGFPGMWWSDAPNWDWYQRWQGWDQKVGEIAAHARGRPIWITETGLATWDGGQSARAKYDLQAAQLEKAAAAPAQRIYWYSLIDLAPRRQAIEGFHVDENEYHMGLVTCEGDKKDAYFRMRQLLDTEKVSG